MIAQDLELARELRTVEEVAGVAVLRDQPQGLLFATAANQYRWMGFAYGQRPADRFGQLEMLGTERFDVSRPHLQRKLKGLFEQLESFAKERVRRPHVVVLAFEPGGADAEVRSPA